MRALGRILVFVCCFAVGALTALRTRRRLLCERACRELMLHGEEKIKRSLCPRSRLFCDFSSPVLSRMGLLGDLQRGEEPYGVCIRYREALGLEEKSFECLKRYFSSLGKLDYSSQLRHCRECIEEYEGLMKEHERRDGDTVGLYLTLGAAAGGFLVLLLL